MRNFGKRKKEIGIRPKGGKSMKKLILSVLIIAAALMMTNSQALGQSNMAGVVSVDSISTQRGEQIAVPVRLDGNTYDIAGLLIPIQYPTDILQFDSVSFIGSFIAPNYTGIYTTEMIPDAVTISYLWTDFDDTSCMSNANGIIGTMFFTVANDASQGNYEIDSVNYIEDLGGIIIVNNIQMSDPSGLNIYYPDFVSGSVEVRVPTGVEDDLNTSLPTDFSLNQNYPNPFNPTTVIEFALPTSGTVKLEVFNILGQKVITLADSHFDAGVHQVEFNAKNQPSGVFFYRLEHENGVETKKMLLVK